MNSHLEEYLQQKKEPTPHQTLSAREEVGGEATSTLYGQA